MAIGNSVNDEIREQQKKVWEQEGFKGKLKYFLYYYKWHVIISLVVIIFFGTSIYDIVTRKDTALQVLMVNGFPNVESDVFMDAFETTIEINTKKEEALMDASFYINTESPTLFDEQNSEKLFVMASAGVVDVVLADEAYFMDMAESGFLLDLSTILTEEQMTLYADRAVYYDSPNNYAEGEEFVGIEVTNSPKMIETQSYPNNKAYFCMIMNAPNIDNAWAFLEYLDTP